MTAIFVYTTQEDQNHGTGFCCDAGCLSPGLHFSEPVWAVNVTSPLTLGLQ